MDADLDDLPPQLPTTLKTLDLARMLLGQRAKRALRPETEARLVELVGRAPTGATQAQQWKRGLSVLREELLGELGSGREHEERAEPQHLSRAS